MLFLWENLGINDIMLLTSRGENQVNYKVLYRKYRPTDFDNLVGQDYTKKMLTNIIESGKIGHAYIFTGPRGTGKTSSAKLFAKAINCLDSKNGNPCGKCTNCEQFATSPDIIEIDAASNNGVDEMRELIDNVKLAPTSMKYKVYIIDEVHMLSASAFNALLLTLEEPPSHVVFILATTDIQKVPITILSRCQRFDFRPIDNKHLIERLTYVSKEENIDITPEALQEIAFISAGGMRDALSILDQVAADNEKVDVDTVIANFGTISGERIKDFVRNFLDDNVSEVLAFLNDVCNKGVYYSVFLEKLILELRNTAIDIKLGKLNYNFDMIYDLILELNGCLSNINININPYTLIEMAILKYLKPGDSKVSTTNSEISDEKNISREINGEIAYDNEENISREINEENAYDNEENISREIKREEAGSSYKAVEVQLELDQASESGDSSSKKPISDNFIKIRVNNCFAEANKESKQMFMDKWKDLLDHLAVSDMYMMSLLADCVVEAASSKYVIISSKVDSTNALINSSIKEVETLFMNLYNIDCRFVALTNDQWLTVKDEYINNLKNKVPYTLIDEEFEETLLDDNDELSKLAMEIFGSDNIEFE